MGVEQHYGFEWARRRIVLAHEPPFLIGSVEVDPVRRQVRRGEQSAILEPRVMQVLVALARAEGAVVTRDELIESCWGGRVVGDDAINRALSRIRRLAADIGGGTFSIETITKVGYRLSISQNSAAALPAPVPERGSPAIGRRPLVAGLAILAAAGAGGGLWTALRPGGRQADADASAYYRKGTEAQREGSTEANLQSVAYLENAVAVDPNFAVAWGALALSYRQLLESKPDHEAERLEAACLSAVRRALELDPGNADAHIALALIRTSFRRWAAAEQDCRRLLRDFPAHWLLPMALGRIMYDVGRVGEGLGWFQRALQIDPFLPSAAAHFGLGLWAAGRLQEANSFLSLAGDRWPSHLGVWLARFTFLAYTGRAAAAAAMVVEADSSPFGLPQERVAMARVVADALMTRSPSRVQAAAESVLRGPVDQAVYFHATVGKLDSAFARAALYFSREMWPDGPQPPGRFTRRSPAFLFAPPTAALRADAHFEDLSTRIGLADYWRSTGTVPDYRR